MFSCSLVIFGGEKVFFLVSFRSENNWKERREKISPFFRLNARKRSETGPISNHLASKLNFFVRNRLPLPSLQVLLSCTGRSGGDDPVRVGGDGEPERRTPRLRGGQAARPATVRHS